MVTTFPGAYIHCLRYDGDECLRCDGDEEK
jgi:hypothetical protein